MPAGPRPSILVLFGDEEYQKSTALSRALDDLLPPTVDRSMALVEYDGARPDEDGGPALAAVMDDLNTLPFLADRRVVIVREADRFITVHRERLEKYLAKPSPTATLILGCRAFPKTSRLYKAASATGEIIECKRLNTRGLVDFAVAEARRLKKRLSVEAANRLVAMIGAEQGAVANEIEKLSLFVGDRPSIEESDIAELVGLSREEKIFAVMDAAGAGHAANALALWRQALASDSAAEYKALGGVAFVLRRWLAAHEALSDGESIQTIAPRLMMWKRERELSALLRRLPPQRLKRNLAGVAELDSQAKNGVRSIETGVEALLIELASAAG